MSEDQKSGFRELPLCEQLQVIDRTTGAVQALVRAVEAAPTNESVASSLQTAAELLNDQIQILDGRNA